MRMDGVRFGLKLSLGIAGLVVWLALSGPAVALGCATAQVRDYRALALAGDAAAQWGLADSYFRGMGVPRNLEEAAIWYRRAAEQGLAQPQYALGLMYATGTGVAKDGNQAARWLRRAAEQGLAAAGVDLDSLAGGTAGPEMAARIPARPRLRPARRICDSITGNCFKATDRSLLAFDGPPDSAGGPTARLIDSTRCP
jgi:TPR repeat protein